MDTVLTIVGVLLVIVALSLVMAFPTMWVMNYLFTPSLLASVFGVSQLIFWKAFWFNAFCGFLIKSTCSHSKD